MPSQAGFSLIEILLVIGIIMLLSIAAFVLIKQVREASRANTEMQNLTTIIAGVRNLYGARADYSGLTTGLANQAHIFPKTMNYGLYTAVAPITHSDNGSVDIEPYDADQRRFAIIYHDVEPAICVRLAQNYGQHVDEVLVGTVSVKEVGEPASDVVAVTTQCALLPLNDLRFVSQ